MADETTKKKNLTRAQRVKEVYEEKQRERLNDSQVLKAEYLKLKDSPVLKDIINKSKAFANYHVKVGRDGVGANADGEVIYFTNEKRVSEFDRSAGNLEISDYIERMIDDPAGKSQLEKDIDAEDDKAEEE